MSKNAVCCTVIVICLFTAACFAKYSGGSGTAEDPYLIATPNDLNSIGLDPNDWDKHFKMTNDIELVGFPGQVGRIGTSSNEPFIGVFDGNGHSIQNFSWHTNDVNYVGLFGYCGDNQNSAVIKNITLTNPVVDVYPRENIGALIGHSRSASLNNCYVINGSVSGGSTVGGLVGCALTGQLSSCEFAGTVNGSEKIGGLVGENIIANISQCKSAGSITATGNTAGGLLGSTKGSSQVNSCCSDANVIGASKVGGLIGSLLDNSDVYNCYATGSVTGTSFCGGLIGYVYHTISSYRNEVINCYSIGLVDGDGSDVEPLIGYRYGACRFEFCYWNSQTSGFDEATRGWPKTTAQMKSAETFFLFGLNGPGLWRIDDGNDYPRLVWENSGGTIIQEPFFAGGSGELNNPYLIATPQQLDLVGAVQDYWQSNFELVSDLNMSGFYKYEFHRIGIGYGNGFSGLFDGKNFTIEGYQQSKGLFTKIGNDGIIKNVILTDPNVGYDSAESIGVLADRLEGGSIVDCSVYNCNVTGWRIVGGLVGNNAEGNISNCDVTGYLKPIRAYGGGITGYNTGIIMNCRVSLQIDGFRDVGGIAGYNYYANIKNCFVDSSLISGYDCVGGVAAKNNGTIFNCSASADIVLTVDNYFGYSAGGLVGWNNGIIENCSSFGTVEGIGHLGGLLGENSGVVLNSFSESMVTLNGVGYIGGLIGENEDDAMVTDSWALGTVSGQGTSGGLIGKNEGIISRCYVSGITNGDGAFVGYLHSSNSPMDGFWNKTLNPTQKSVGNGLDNSFPEIVKLTTTEMQTLSTFTDAGWDFFGETVNGPNDIWRMCVDGVNYPKLSWELLEHGDLTCPDGVDFIDYFVLANEWRLERLEQDYNSDGRVNFKDWAIFANNWEGSYIELPPFVACWLERSARIADIAPVGGDDFVDWQDLAILAAYWLDEK